MEHAIPTPGLPDIETLHQTLVDQLLSAGEIRTPAVETAFRAVPRHLFLPGVDPAQVYRDQSIAVKHLDGVTVSSSSQPAMMAVMLEQLAPQPGQRVLEIGTGTGYNAALLAHLVGPTGQVVTIDIDEDLVTQARAHLAAAGYTQVRVVCADGGLGAPDTAPYDRIILTVGTWDITPAWWEQLTPGGRLLLPLTLTVGPQKSVALERQDDHLASVSVQDCGFIRLRGAFAGPKKLVQLAAEAGLFLVSDRQVDSAQVYAWLTGPRRDWATGIYVTSREIWGGLSLWLALHEPGYCDLGAEGAWAERDLVPPLLQIAGLQKHQASIGLVDDTGLCALLRPPDWTHPPAPATAPPPFALWARSFGPDETVARRLLAHIQAWDQAGRPGTGNLRLRVYPAAVPYSPTLSEIVIPKRWTQLVLEWS